MRLTEMIDGKPVITVEGMDEMNIADRGLLKQGGPKARK
jgi:hypothetical protein